MWTGLLKAASRVSCFRVNLCETDEWRFTKPTLDVISWLLVPRNYPDLGYDGF